MKTVIRNFFRFVFLAVFCVSTFFLLRQFLDNHNGSASYENALSIATQGEALQSLSSEPAVTVEEENGIFWAAAPIEEEDPYIEELRKIDIAALQEVNPDVLGWLYIPDSQINYPILQGENNDHYLKHTWDGKENSVGSIFMESRNSPDFTQFNTILYGHNMTDGSMFSGLSNFLSQWYFDGHPHIYLVLPEHILRYDVFAAYQAPVEDPTYGLSFYQKQTRVNFLDNAFERSHVETELIPQLNDRILTLSTCTGRGYSTRWVVLSRLKMIQAEQ